MTDKVIEIRGLHTQFGQFVVHRDLDLDVRRGEILSLVGGSGSGKTTLLRQMLGLERPTRGSVQVFGEDVHRASAVHRHGKPHPRDRWGMLFQHGALFSALSVFDNVALPMRELRTLPEGLIRQAVLLKLDMVGISPADASKMPSDLSGGMVKRVALARSLAEKHVIAEGTPEQVMAVEHPFIKQFFLGERGQRALEVLRSKEV